MTEINKDQLLDKILHSGDFTALEKRYLEELVKRDRESLPQEYRDTIMRKFCDRR